jgi:hypothetical protein
MKAYGKELVNQMPDATTELLMQLCTGYRAKGGAGGGELGSSLPKAQPQDFIHIFVNQTASLLKFLEHMVQQQPDSAPQVYDTLLELYLQSGVDPNDATAVQQHDIRVLDLLQNSAAKYDDHHAMVLAQVYDFKVCSSQRARCYVVGGWVGGQRCCGPMLLTISSILHLNFVALCRLEFCICTRRPSSTFAHLFTLAEPFEGSFLTH